MYPTTCTDDRLSAALLRLVNRKGRFIGTAFAISDDGICITCDHVLRSGQAVEAIDQSANRFAFDRLDTPGLGDIDLALVRLRAAAARFPLPLPLLNRLNPTPFRMRAWLDAETGVVDSLPINGMVSGPTSIRYSRSGRDYGAQGVVTLTGASIEPGMSGSPLVDSATDAVVAIVVAKFAPDRIAAGFGLPVALLDRDPLARQIYAGNCAGIPRFGLRPNGLAAKKIADTLNATILTAGKASGLFDPDRFVRRDTFSETVALFLKSDATTLAVFGPAGTGKTTALAALARQLSATSSLFIRAIDIGGPEVSLEELVWRRLAKVYVGPDESLPSLQALATAAAEGGSPLLILLDGLNEARLDRAVLLDRWLPEAIDTLAALNARLIFTARGEYKDAVLSRDYAGDFFAAPTPEREPGAPPPPPNETAFVLGFYNTAEFEAARDAYDLRAQEDDPELRHPLTLRLASEIARRDGPPRQSFQLLRRAEVLERLLMRIVQRVAESNRAAHPKRILAFCEELAEEAGRSTGNQLPIDGDPDRSDHALFEALLRENVLEATPNGYRFLFDAFVDYLRSRRADVLQQMSAAVSSGAFDRVQRDVVVLALAQRIARNEIDEVLVAIGGLIEALRRQAPGIESLIDRIVASTPPHPALDTLKDDYLDARLTPELDEFSVDLFDHAIWSFNTKQLTRLLRELMLGTEGYGWRRQDFGEAERRWQTRSYALSGRGVFRAVSRLFEATPEAAFDILTDLLPDDAALMDHNQRGESSEASVGSLSACLLYAHWQSLGAERIWRKLAGTASPFNRAIIGAIVEEDPDQALDLIEREIARSTGAERKHLLFALDALPPLAETPHHQRLSSIIRALVENGGEDPGFLFALASFQAGSISPDLMTQLAFLHQDRTGNIELVVKSLLQGWLTPEQALSRVANEQEMVAFWRQTLGLMNRRFPQEDILKQAIRALRSDTSGLSRRSSVAFDLEGFFYELDYGTAVDTGVFGFAAELIRSGAPNLLRSFAFFSIPAEHERPGVVTSAIEIQKLLATEPVSDEIRHFMIARFADYPPSPSADVVRSLLRPLPVIDAAIRILKLGVRVENDTRIWMLGLYREQLEMPERQKLDDIIEQLRQFVDRFEIIEALSTKSR